MSLPRRVEAGYGAAELGINGVEVLIRVGLLIFYTDVVGLAPDLAGYAVALGVLWDAVTDPLMGRISDRTRARLGRRRPYIALGAVLLAIAVVVLFSPPQLDTQAGRFTVLLLSYIVANTAMTIIAVPHSAFAGDLATDVSGRTRLFGWRLLFANLGLVAGAALPGLLVAGSDAARAPGEADRIAAVLVAGIVLLAAGATLLATRGRDRPAPRRDVHRGVAADYLGALGALAGNRVFRPLLAAWVVANIGLSVNSATALYYYRYRLELEEAHTRGLIALFMLVFCLSIPAWIAVSRRLDLRPCVVSGALVLGVMTCVAYPLFPAGNPWWPVVACVLGGLAIGCVVLLEAMLADVVDHDRVHSGEARFGLYFGVWRLGAKASRALAIAITGNVLAWIGFEPNAAQTADTSWGLALLFGPGVGVTFLVAALLLWWHPLDAEQRERVQGILAARAE